MAEVQEYDFLWVPFFEDLSQWLLKQRNNQVELISLLEQAGVDQGLDDKIASGSRTKLTEVDPFSFFSLFLKYGHSKRTKTLNALNQLVGFTKRPAPDEYHGVPSAQAQKAWFFPYAYERKVEDIPVLWDLFEQALKGEIENNTFARALKIKAVAATKLTQGLFWVAPNKFFPVDRQTRPFLKAQGVDPHCATWRDYERLMKEVRLRTTQSFPKLSYEAWLSNQVKEKTVNRNSMQVQAKALNQIFYGPPGTGKTYATKAQAVAILDNQLPEIRAAINQRYQELVQAKRIIFVTFHQSSTYEDFVEGIKPVMGADEDDGELHYKIEDGVFKRMCVEATYEFVKRQNKEQAAGKTLDFSQRLDQLLNQFQQQLDDGEQIEIPLKSGQQIRVEEISKQGNFILRHVDGDRTYTVSQTRLEKLFNEIKDFDQIPNVYAYFRSIIGGSNASAYWAILNQLYQQEAIAPQQVEQQLATVDYATKQQAFYRMDWQQATDQDVVPKYLMIIDEINRGNIAAIFGELITLLEEDKRGGRDEYLSVVLPYSKERLVVPPNLYLIGTMNTADRSVEALDTALRRRFAFQEVAPNSKLLSPKAMIQANWNRYVNSDWDEKDFRSHCNRLYDFLGLPEKDRNSLEKASKAEKGVEVALSQLSYLDQVTLSGVNLEKILSTINRRIELLLDKDHCIGHAYFMSVATADDPWQALREVFAQKVLPLLEEYFFGATGKIQLVLGPAFCIKSETNQENTPFATGAKFGDGEYDQREIYRTVDIMAMGEEKFLAGIQTITA